MKKRHQRSVTILGQATKSSIHSHAQRSRRILKSIPHQTPINPFTSNSQNWYQMKKRAQQRLRALSNGKIRLVTDPSFPQMYYGHHIRHYLLDMETEHIFKASLREVAFAGAEKINPFINSPLDMDHYGSLGAIQEHVYGLSMGNMDFLPDNELSGVDDLYGFSCAIHPHRVAIPFSDFLSDPLAGCGLCQFEKE